MGGCASTTRIPIHAYVPEEEIPTARTDLSQLTQSSTRLKLAAYLELNSNKLLNGTLRIFSKHQETADLNTLDGAYAYCIVQQTLGNTQKQYLLLSPLKNHDSNHGLFRLLYKKIPGFSANNTQILAGGEMIFDVQNSKLCWNLKSLEFSHNSEFNEDLCTPELLKANIDRLWLPSHSYLSIAASEKYPLNELFSASGSFKANSRTVVPCTMWHKSSKKNDASEASKFSHLSRRM